MNVSHAKFHKKFDSRTNSRELPQGKSKAVHTSVSLSDDSVPCCWEMFEIDCKTLLSNKRHLTRLCEMREKAIRI